MWTRGPQGPSGSRSALTQTGTLDDVPWVRLMQEGPRDPADGRPRPRPQPGTEGPRNPFLFLWIGILGHITVWGTHVMNACIHETQRVVCHQKSQGRITLKCAKDNLMIKFSLVTLFGGENFHPQSACLVLLLRRDLIFPLARFLLPPPTSSSATLAHESPSLPSASPERGLGGFIFCHCCLRSRLWLCAL